MSFVQDLLSDLYPWTLVIHIIAVISWMAGIFYLPRLFVHHVEKGAATPEIIPVFIEMEYKLLKVIMNPAMTVTWIFGLAMVFTPGLIDWSEWWPWVKAVMVIGMTWFHHMLVRWRKELAEGRSERTGKFFRIANEVPTVLMMVIVAMVIARPF
ncbi:MAG: CopD family protein [Pikeienuella sp.]